MLPDIVELDLVHEAGETFVEPDVQTADGGEDHFPPAFGQAFGQLEGDGVGAHEVVFVFRGGALRGAVGEKGSETDIRGCVAGGEDKDM